MVQPKTRPKPRYHVWLRAGSGRALFRSERTWRTRSAAYQWMQSRGPGIVLRSDKWEKVK